MHRRSLTLLLFLFLPCLLFGQGITSGLDVFGYFQSTFENSWETTRILDFPASSVTRNTFILQQANVFFRKQFGSQFTSFVNLEFTNSYFSSRGWGTFRVEEGWVRYEPSDCFSVKAGLLVPTFNNLNEIKNRMPLLPYIIRPVVYEAAAEGIASSDEFVPQSAFLQVEGTVHLSDIRLDYVAYTGNGDPSFTTAGTKGGNYVIGGVDTTSFKLLGARVGMRVGKVKTGFSITSDKANRADIGLGAIQRYRFGGDLSFQVGPVSLESEIIATEELMDDHQLQVFRAMAMYNPLLGTKPSNLFSYGVVTYDISEMFYAFGGIEYMQYHESAFTRGAMAGGGIRPIDQIVVKLEYLYINATTGSLSTYRSHRLQAGISVMF